MLEDAVAKLTALTSRGASGAPPLPGARAMAGARFARRCRAAAEDGRRGLEAQEWVQWKPRLIMLLEEMGAPSLETARTCTDPERAKNGGTTGRTRINTVRSHARAVETARRWLLRAHGAPWPVTIAHYIDYVHAKAAEPRGQAVPKQALRAMVWTERGAGVDQNDRLLARPEA
ncbi:unnamed protein product [Prorocentrum cordatum]|uniref:Uncharacterized protein n=1 Tax=Prorocentrum cordatum TaxID=2364126 RepID=A0ABN9XGW8_9DINO|nr:unnamed protein product [Polarella glacialis]